MPHRYVRQEVRCQDCGWTPDLIDRMSNPIASGQLHALHNVGHSVQTITTYKYEDYVQDMEDEEDDDGTDSPG